MPTIYIVESFADKKSSQLIPNVAISREKELFVNFMNFCHIYYLFPNF